MSKVDTTNGVFIPGYALPYLLNGDSSGIEADDIQAVDNWLNGYLLEFSNVSNYSIDTNSDSPDMFAAPAFGLPSNCYDCSVTVFYN